MLCLNVHRFGFSRLNFAYFLDDDTVDYVLRAIDSVATNGWKLLPQVTILILQYHINPCVARLGFKPIKMLSKLAIKIARSRRSINAQ